MAANDRPRETRRLRARHVDAPDRLFGLPEMAALLSLHPKTLIKQMKAHDGSVPPAFQPNGPGTPWKFSERSYLAWLHTQERDA